MYLKQVKKNMFTIEQFISFHIIVGMSCMYCISSMKINIVLIKTNLIRNNAWDSEKS